MNALQEVNVDMYEEIIEELNNFCFKRNSISYQYLIEAIKIVTKNQMTIKDFNFYVYPQIAKKYDTKPQNVLWCISKLIKGMYLNTDAKIINEYFGTPYFENPSTKAFIIHISYKILKKINAETLDIKGITVLE